MHLISRIYSAHRSILAVSTLALCAGVGSAQATSVVLDYDLTGGFQFGASSLSYEVGGVGLTLTAGTFADNGTINGSASLNRLPTGVGVSSHFLDIPGVDGAFNNDVVFLSFDEDVSFNSITFAFADTNDDFQFFFDANDDGTVTPLGGPTNIGSFTPFFGADTTYSFRSSPTGGLFGIGAQGFFDDFQIRSVNVTYEEISAVPLPAGLPLLMVGMGAFGLMRRKARKA